jgi:transcriptional regulator with XRE-family HTH domain
MPLNKTIIDGLQPYAIGQKLHAFRLRKKLSLVELGKQAGLSAAMLSKIENGKLFPTLRTLELVCRPLQVELRQFFLSDGRPLCAITRRKDRIRLPESRKAKKPAYYFESLDFVANERKLNSYLAEFEPVEPKDVTMHQRPGEELVFVLSGTLIIHIGNEEHTLSVGDSILFDSSVPHGYRRKGKEICRALVFAQP